MTEDKEEVVWCPSSIDDRVLSLENGIHTNDSQ